MFRTFGWARARLTGLLERRDRASTPKELRAGEPFARFLREFESKNAHSMRRNDHGLHGIRLR
jgi:hypothetical protein